MDTWNCSRKNRLTFFLHNTAKEKKKLFKQFTHEKIAATEKNIVLKTNYVVSYVDRASVYTTLVLDI